MESYNIYLANEENAYTVPLTENGKVKSFDCAYAAEVYAKSVGLKNGYKIASNKEKRKK